MNEFAKFAIIAVILLLIGGFAYIVYFSEYIEKLNQKTGTSKTNETGTAPGESGTGCINGTNGACKSGPCDGVRVCRNGAWSECYVIRVCTPGSNTSCNEYGCGFGYRTCNECGTGYGACVKNGTAAS